jgi:hypothetical protein
MLQGGLIKVVRSRSGPTRSAASSPLWLISGEAGATRQVSPAQPWRMPAVAHHALKSSPILWVHVRH